jgi:hypothetical protein
MLTPAAKIKQDILRMAISDQDEDEFELDEAFDLECEEDISSVYCNYYDELDLGEYEREYRSGQVETNLPL